MDHVVHICKLGGCVVGGQNLLYSSALVVYSSALAVYSSALAVWEGSTAVYSSALAVYTIYHRLGVYSCSVKGVSCGHLGLPRAAEDIGPSRFSIANRCTSWSFWFIAKEFPL